MLSYLFLLLPTTTFAEVKVGRIFFPPPSLSSQSWSKSSLSCTPGLASWKCLGLSNALGLGQTAMWWPGSIFQYLTIKINILSRFNIWILGNQGSILEYLTIKINNLTRQGSILEYSTMKINILEQFMIWMLGYLWYLLQQNKNTVFWESRLMLASMEIWIFDKCIIWKCWGFGKVKKRKTRSTKILD